MGETPVRITRKQRVFLRMFGSSGHIAFSIFIRNINNRKENMCPIGINCREMFGVGKSTQRRSKASVCGETFLPRIQVDAERNHPPLTHSNSHILCNDYDYDRVRLVLHFSPQTFFFSFCSPFLVTIVTFGIKRCCIPPRRKQK